MISAVKLVHFVLVGNENQASSRVRGFWIAEELRGMGLKCKVSRGRSKWELIWLFITLPCQDVIVFQKTISRYHKWLLLAAKLLGKRTYLDIDDAPSRSFARHTLKNVETMMRNASGVFAGSSQLRSWAMAFQEKTFLVPSGIRLENYKLRREQNDNGDTCLGWIGNGAHYKDDLISILVEPLTELARMFDIRFKIVGSCGVEAIYQAFSSIPGLEVEFVDQIDWSNPDAVTAEIADFDIGLYPLLDNEFNRYKCGFKALEYMASGIPVVSSDVAANSDIITDGVDGYLVSGTEEWTDALAELISNSQLRESMGRAGNQTVEKHFDVSLIAGRIRQIIGSCDGNHKESPE